MAKKTQKKDTEIHVDRRNETQRRATGADRRKNNVPVTDEQRTGERRKVARRRQIDPTTCERDYSGDEIEFMHALDDYKRANGRMFPTCSEILEVVRKLGYQKGNPDDLDLVDEVALPEEFALSDSPFVEATECESDITH